MIRFVHDLGIHQHMYTNGTLCTEQNLKELADAGLEEIRFNLAATHCATRVIEAMAMARDLFQYVCIESPMVPAYFDAFVRKREQILATGVDHIHCAELHLNKNNIGNYAREELYQYNDGYVSPMSSRRLTYDLLDLAVQEGWQDVVIHDCSNEIKFLRGVSDEALGSIQYESEIDGLPITWFRDALKKYDFSAPS